MFVKIVFIHCLNTKWNIYFQLLGINMYLYLKKKNNFVLIIKNFINHKFYHYTFSLSNEYRIFRAMCKYGAWKT